MRTRSQTRNRNRRQQQQTPPVVVEPCNLEEPIPEQTIVAMADRTMEELLRAPTEGYREDIVLPEINADHFEIKTNLLQLVQANPFHGLDNENPHAHINKFDESFSEAWERFKDSLNAAAGGNLLSKTTREALNIIENKSKVRYSRNKTNASRVNSKENVSKTDERIDKLADQLPTLVEIVSKKVVVPPAPVKAVEENCVTCDGAHACFFQRAQASPSGTLPSNTIPNPKGEMKAITTRSGVAYEGPSNPTKPSPKEVVERETEEITDEEQNDFQGSTAQIPPPVIPKPIPEPEIRRIYQNRPTTDPTLRFRRLYLRQIFLTLQDETIKRIEKKLHTKKKRFFKLNEIKKRLLEIVKIAMTKNCSAMLLKKLPEKLGDPGKFLIPCEFPGMEICYALADLDISILRKTLKKEDLTEATGSKLSPDWNLPFRVRTMTDSSNSCTLQRRMEDGTAPLEDHRAQFRFEIPHEPKQDANQGIDPTISEAALSRTDISKITRNPSKTGKHRHEKRKSTRKAKDSKPKPKKVNLQSTLGQQKIGINKDWAEAVSTACYVQNRVLVFKPHNKIPYELFRGFKPSLSFIRPFGCHVTILNTLDSLGKFDGKSDEGFFVGYSLSSKAFKVYKTRTRRVEENLHIRFLENKPMLEGNGPKWLFDIDSLTQSMNYVPIAAGTITNESTVPYIENDEKDKYKDDSSHKEVNTVGQHVNTASPKYIEQKEEGIFISQDKYVVEILKKFNYTDVKSASTPVDLEKPLVKDGDADDVDVHLYRSMIGSLMYLTASRPDIMFAVCACARFQVTPKTSHLLAVKRIFRYLKGKPTLGLWYSRDSPFELVAYTDSDYAGATQDRKSTTGVATSTTKAEYVAAASCCGQVKHIEYVVLNASPLKHVKRGRDTKIPQSSGPLVKVGDEAVHKELGDRTERAATTASSLKAEQDSVTIDRKVKIIVSEGSIRRHLKLEDSEGIPSLPTAEIFEQLALMGYVTTSDSLTFQKRHFSPQWKFFIHTILHCLSPKKTA
ncbi:reverse transcriptase domain-containing protein [Tanacetum coccineum]|uniref:Reverse transcriptase domain-containing protein n=1 Tax=Tanacetum coccineum TaxID=301880 RepID=A0ABQ5F468_9ASTR